MTHDQFCTDHPARCAQGRRSRGRVRRTHPHRHASLDRRRGPRRQPIRTQRPMHELPQRKPAEDGRYDERRHRGSDPETALRVVRPVATRTPSTGIEQGLYTVIMEAYVHGGSTRNVDDLVAALGVDSGVSKSQVSRICAVLDTAIARFRERTLTHTSFPYIFPDATYCKCGSGHRWSLTPSSSRPGVDRRHPGIPQPRRRRQLVVRFLARVPGRVERAWTVGVHLVISDADAGLKAVVAQHFIVATLSGAFQAERRVGGLVEACVAGDGSDQGDLRAHRTRCCCAAVGSGCRYVG